jgi:hypothetical protein
VRGLKTRLDHASLLGLEHLLMRVKDAHFFVTAYDDYYCGISYNLSSLLSSINRIDARGFVSILLRMSELRQRDTPEIWGLLRFLQLWQREMSANAKEKDR